MLIAAASQTLYQTQSVTRTSKCLPFSYEYERGEFVYSLSSSPSRVPSDADAPWKLQRHLPYLSCAQSGSCTTACGGGTPRTTTGPLLRDTRSPVQPALRFCLRPANVIVGRTRLGGHSVRQHNVHPAIQGKTTTSYDSRASSVKYCLFELSRTDHFSTTIVKYFGTMVWYCCVDRVLNKCTKQRPVRQTVHSIPCSTRALVDYSPSSSDASVPAAVGDATRY